MPNYCDCFLKINGAIDDLDSLQKTIRNGKIPFDFEKVIPTPTDLIEEVAPASSIHKARANNIQYGANDWYDWRLKNWGCKWTLNEDTYVERTDKSLTLAFNTAWAPPIGIITKLAEMYPHLHFFMTYLEIGMCFGGILEASEGGITQDSMIECSKDKDLYEQFMQEYFPDTYDNIKDLEAEQE